jgi:hypothetical protein
LFVFLALARLTGRTRAQDAWDLPVRARQAVERQSSFLEDTDEAGSWHRRDTVDRSNWDDGRDRDSQDLVAESPANGESSTIAQMLDDRLKVGDWLTGCRPLAAAG